jgi:hypothetical protein
LDITREEVEKAELGPMFGLGAASVYQFFLYIS